MKEFVLLSLLTYTLAAPEAWYNYPSPSQPRGNYGAPRGGGGEFGGVGLIQKHIYVYVPPPQPEELGRQRPIVTAAPQKHYKIIFIKAPSVAAPAASVIPLQPQNEEKTLVYVLVKKPESAAEISIPTPAPTQPSKPEVYFIRYKSKTQDGEFPQFTLPSSSPGDDGGGAGEGTPVPAKPLPEPAKPLPEPAKPLPEPASPGCPKGLDPFICGSLLSGGNIGNDIGGGGFGGGGGRGSGGPSNSYGAPGKSGPY